MSPCTLPQPWTDGEHCGAVQQRLKFLRTMHRVSHQFRARTIERKKIVATSGNADQAGTATQRRLATQTNRTCGTVIATDRQHMAAIAFMRIACTRRQMRRLQQCRVGGHPLPQDIGQPKRIDLQRSHLGSGLRCVEASLGSDKTHRELRTDRRARTMARIRVQPRRHIECQHRDARDVDAFDQRSRCRIGRAIQTGAIERVHIHVCVGQ